MASNKAHHATGWAAGVIAAAVVAHLGAGGPYQVLSVLAFLMGALGGMAPDWMEVAWWARTHKLWITHRTWTHWGLAWIALLAYSYLQLPHHAWAPPLFGFAAGGIMHLLADWPNPLGVPWIFRRHSLRWWKSGRHDLIVIITAWLAATVVADHVFFDGVHLHYATGALDSLLHGARAALHETWASLQQWLLDWRQGV
ncbi:metal-dependent hydrolase [Janthinobacterium sp.]|uniref:metal-dependent hydrolase n=1 Tax=Janthinobacterium sp. TaxID=1871054 RepID=UPI00261E0570|nr:metal-dependent hydrolase [Janthinobacterium sp.]